MKYFTGEAIQLFDLSQEQELKGVSLMLFDVGKLPDDLIFELGRLLSPRELRKAGRLRNIKDRRVYLAGRGMLRKIAAETLRIYPRDLAIGEAQYGKPFFLDFENVLTFNLSHSGSVVALVFDFERRHVGVDVEAINPEFEYEELVEHYFSQREGEQIASHRDFFRFWTMKEALLKATGAGLVEQLHLMDISDELNLVKADDERLLAFKNKSFSLYTFENEQAVVTLALSNAQLQDSGSRAGNIRFSQVYFY